MFEVHALQVKRQESRLLRFDFKPME
jgi:hypothetical protein